MSLPLPSDDPFFPFLRLAIDRNFPKSQRVKEVSPPITSPITFYDRHLASHLILKRVRIVPSIHERLADSIMEPLRKFVSDGHKFDSSKYLRFGRTELQKPMEHAAAVGQAYCATFGAEMVRLISKLLFIPDIPEWMSLIGFTYERHINLPGMGFFTEGCIGVNTTGSSLHLGKSQLAKLPKAAEKAALDLDAVYDWLANWSFFPPTKRGKAIVASIPSTTIFNWDCAHTLGIAARRSNLPIPPDASEGFAVEVVEEYLAGRRKVAEEKQPQPPGSKKGEIKIPALRKSQEYAPVSRDYIQKVWTIAVREDTTYMIFNCGTYERIGIRDRATQTLYLSGLIETTNSNPIYGRIQLGLYLAILQDAMARKEARKKFDRKHKTSLKRSAEDDDVDDRMPPAKRQKRGDSPPPVKLANAIETYEASQAEKEMSKRSILLINIKYGNYDSPVPSSFIRLGSSCVRGLFDKEFAGPQQRKTYGTTEYMTASLQSPFGSGAIGTAHRAIVDVVGPSGKILHHPCLVKLAFTADAQKALEHEFDIYRHLVQKGSFSGVVRIHGLFRDTQSDTVALLMDFAGYSLRRRERRWDDNFDKDYVVIEKNERDVILEGFERLHQAGVNHNDVRIDNIVINDGNEVAIIDFDRATLSEESTDHEKEMKTVRDTVFCRHESISDGNTSDGG